MVIIGDSLEELKKLPGKSVNCCVTSPPYYGLRDYGNDKQIGLEETPREYIEKLVIIFDEVSRVLKDNGTLWLNIGDSYAGNGGGNKLSGIHRTNKGSQGNKYRHPGTIGLKPKDLIGIPWMLAFALRDRGWFLRQDIIWSKPNPMPESVKDRFTKSHEYIFLFSKSKEYYFDQNSVKEPIKTGSNGSRFDIGKTGINKNRNWGNDKLKRNKNAKKINGNAPGRDDAGRSCNNPSQTHKNKRSVWSISLKPYRGAHFATFPPKLIEPCIIAGCPENGIVLDPFFGSGTVGQVAKENGRDFIGIELNPEYKPLIEKRIEKAHYQKSF